MPRGRSKLKSGGRDKMGGHALQEFWEHAPRNFYALRCILFHLYSFLPSLKILSGTIVSLLLFVSFFLIFLHTFQTTADVKWRG